MNTFSWEWLGSSSSVPLVPTYFPTISQTNPVNIYELRGGGAITCSSHKRERRGGDRDGSPYVAR